LRIVAESNAAEMTSTEFAPLDDEPVEMVVAPPQSGLQRGVHLGDGRVAADEQAAPDQRADSTKDDTLLIDTRPALRKRLG